MIEITALCAGYPGKNVLQHTDLHIPAGKVTVIVGPNGCGKSTLLKAITGILPHSSGRILVNGQDLSCLPPKEAAKKVSYLAQDRQIPDITVLRMVLHGRFPYLSYPRRYRAEDMEIARNAMEQMGLSGLEHEMVGTLSGGTRQKVYIAMALAQDTPVILMDEPTTFLDVGHQLQTMEQAKRLAAAGKAVVLVLHDLPLAMQTADLLAVMENGTIIRTGTPEAVFESGCMDRVFGVTLQRFRTPGGWQYYYETGERG